MKGGETGEEVEWTVKECRLLWFSILVPHPPKETDSMLVREAERVEGEMDFRHLNDIARFSFGMGFGRSVFMVIAR